MRLRLYYLLGVIALFTFSCTKYKDVPYFQGIKRDSLISEKITNFKHSTIQTGDLLAIHVTSLNREADAFINYNLERQGGSAVSIGRPEENSVVGYLVDVKGLIDLAYIGKVKASGLTLEELTVELQNKLSKYLTSPLVAIRMQNFRVSVMGDVKAPGVYYSVNDRLSLPEALSMAGDLNTTGLRKNVLLIREIDGERKYFNIDLTSKELFTSPYYYLKSNDVIYIQPSKEKVQASDSAFQKTSILISALSLLAIFVTRYK